MILYKDTFTNDELFMDIYPMEELDDGLILKVKGKHEVRKVGMDGPLLGANASAEEQPEETEDATISGINIVLACRLVEIPQDKKVYKGHITAYMKALAKKITEEHGKERCEEFQTKAKEFMTKFVMKNFKELTFFCGESMQDGGMLTFSFWDEETPYMYFFKDGLLPEKV